MFGEDELKKMPTGIDIVGDIAVIKLPRGWEGEGHEVGERLLAKIKSVKGVFRQSAPASKGDRIRGLEWLAGKTETTTMYREHGCMFNVDIAKVYFSPRLSHERLRIAGLARRGEVAVNMFAGVGTFSIVLAKLGGASKVYSIDKNPDAFRYMKENVLLNRLEGVVVPILGDAKDASEGLKAVADRVLMPLPELAYEYLPYGLDFLKKKGWIHLYTHQRSSSRTAALVQAKEMMRGAIGGVVKVDSISARVVRSVGSRLFQVVCDAGVDKEEMGT
jgi:tRNA (guanine37-N1)-methyltransferase